MDTAAVRGARPSRGSAADVRGEAARLESRLGVARDRLDALLPPRASGPGAAPRGPGAAPRDPGAAPRRGLTRFDDDDNVDPDLRELLRPAASRVTQLLELAASVADGTRTDAEAAEAARTIANAQPHRRPR